jgi:hypothetical protein
LSITGAETTNVEIQDLCRTLIREAVPGAGRGIERYLELDRSVRKAVADFPGVKTNVEMKFGKPFGDRLRAALVLSDLAAR